MEIPITELQFSERERKYYSIEFDKITSEQSAPLHERQLTGQAAFNFFKTMKIPNNVMAQIWEICSDNRDYLQLTNFMAVMRMCSAYRQGKGISQSSLLTEQSVLVRRGGGGQKNKAAASTNQQASEQSPPKEPLQQETEENKQKPAVWPAIPKPHDAGTEDDQFYSVVDMNQYDLPRLVPTVSIEHDYQAQSPPLPMLMQAQKSEEIEQLDKSSVEKPKFTPSIREILHVTAPESVEKTPNEPPVDSQVPYHPEPPHVQEDISLGVSDQMEPEQPLNLHNYIQPPTNAPVSKPVNPPVSKPVNPPVSKPVNPPVSKPVNPPVIQPTNQPVSQPVQPAVQQKLPKQQYKNEQPKSECAITVERPTLVKQGWFGAQSYYVYTVITVLRNHRYSVKRRFRDLD